MKKRILIFSTAYFPFIGGAEVAVKEITDRIPEMEFVMITARLDAKLLDVEKYGNIEIHRIGNGSKLDKVRLILYGASHAQNLGHFDAIWSIMASYGGFAALRLKERNLEVPFLLTLQEGDSKWDIYKHVWWCWPYFKQIFNKANRIQAISNYLAKWAKDMGAKCPVEVVPNGVDLNKFQRSTPVTLNEVRNSSALSIIQSRARRVEPKDPVGIKEKLSIPSNAKVVITVSRLVKKNGLSDLIKSLKFISGEVHLLVAGDGILKEELESLARRIGLASSVHFLGNVDHFKLSQYFKISNVFCRPSLSEGLGNVFLEAMAGGLPAMATKVGGIPDFLEDGKTGWYCEVKNPESIAGKIKYILDEKNKVEVAVVVENAKKMVEEKYSWDMVANKMKSIFLGL